MHSINANYANRKTSNGGDADDDSTRKITNVSKSFDFIILLFENFLTRNVITIALFSRSKLVGTIASANTITNRESVWWAASANSECERRRD